MPPRRSLLLLAGGSAAVLLLLLLRSAAAAAVRADGRGEPAFIAFHLKYFLAGSLCACLSHVGGVPIDVLKTRLQTDPGRYDGLFDAAWKVTRTEGPAMLLQGLGPTAAGYAIQGGLKYGLYELFKVFLAGQQGAQALALPLLLVAAGTAELIASTALCPYEAARIRLVADPSFALGLVPALKRLTSEQGMHGVFGTLPAMYLKMVPYTMAQLVTYDGVTRFLAGRVTLDADWGTLGVALVGAATAAVVASLASQPGDTLLSMLNQGRRTLMGGPLSRPGSAAAARARRAQGRAATLPAAHDAQADKPAQPPMTSSDDELEMLEGGAPAVGATGSDKADATPLGLQSPPGSPRDGSHARAATSLVQPSGFGCGPMCALAARLGPTGLMLGWDARLMHTGTIVLVQLLVYDAVKAAVGLPVSAHGVVDRRLAL